LLAFGVGISCRYEHTWAIDSKSFFDEIVCFNQSFLIFCNYFRMSTHKTASIVFLLLTLVIALLLAGLSTRVATTVSSAAPVPLPPQKAPGPTPNVPPPPIQQAAFVPSSTATFAQATAYTSAYVPTTRVQPMASDSTREFDHLTALPPF
jgi:hypothetical protein